MLGKDKRLNDCWVGNESQQQEHEFCQLTSMALAVESQTVNNMKMMLMMWKRCKNKVKRELGSGRDIGRRMARP